MKLQDKPAFATWEHRNLAQLASDLWDQNVSLRDANEQLRLDNRDLSALVRKLNTTEKDDWK